MAVLETSPGAIDVPDAMIRAATASAEHQAELVAKAIAKLQANSPHSRLASAFSAPFLLEFAAVLQIEDWEWNGYTAHREAGLPSHAEAVRDLVGRCVDAANDRTTLDSPLARRVMTFHLQAFAWDGPEILGVKCLLERTDDDTLVDQLAEFLWAHRRELASVIDKETSNETA